MKQRLNYAVLSSDILKKYLDLYNYVHNKETVNEFSHIVTILASQLNGCAFCLDIHVKEAKIHGERELRVHHIPVWRESPLFNDREKAALLWTETLTHLEGKSVSDEVYEEVSNVLSEKEISDLSFLIVLINGFNRFGIAFRPVPGSSDVIYGLEKSGLK